MNPLNYFKLGLSNTKITSDCFDKVLKSLNDAKWIELRLENTMVANKTLETFLESKLSAQRICNKLNIAVDRTRIHSDLRQKIEKISKEGLQNGSW